MSCEFSFSLKVLSNWKVVSYIYLVMPSTLTLGSWTTTFGLDVLTASISPEFSSLSWRGLLRTQMQMFIYVALTWLRAAPTFALFWSINKSYSTSLTLPAAWLAYFLSSFASFICCILALLASLSASIFWIPFIIFNFNNLFCFLILITKI